MNKCSADMLFHCAVSEISFEITSCRRIPKTKLLKRRKLEFLKALGAPTNIFHGGRVWIFLEQHIFGLITFKSSVIKGSEPQTFKSLKSLLQMIIYCCQGGLLE